LTRGKRRTGSATRRGKRFDTTCTSIRSGTRPSRRREPSGSRVAGTGTYEFYKSHLDNHIFPQIGHLKVVDVDVATIEQEVRDPLVAANKLVTANKVLTTLTTFWTWAMNRKYTNPERRNPAELAEPVRILDHQRKSRGPERVYTPDEIRRIVEAADSLKFKAAFALLSLGTRREEVLGFKWADVSPAWDSIHVQRAVTLAKGPGETKRQAKLKDVKSTAGDRLLPLQPPIATILKKGRLQYPANEPGPSSP
jgi:integrase